MKHTRESPSASHAMRMNGWNDGFQIGLDNVYQQDAEVPTVAFDQAHKIAVPLSHVFFYLQSG